ncbi:MAG: hypothetical protein FRX49_09885 [Trebouxia sp. A1-2]|nr:MAG: hypothetical protein FRX49_09885 [Trebouxia sp. A1-2]
MGRTHVAATAALALTPPDSFVAATGRVVSDSAAEAARAAFASLGKAEVLAGATVALPFCAAFAISANVSSNGVEPSLTSASIMITRRMGELVRGGGQSKYRVQPEQGGVIWAPAVLQPVGAACQSISIDHKTQPEEFTSAACD